jgi:hypothetical protein
MKFCKKIAQDEKNVNRLFKKLITMLKFETNYATHEIVRFESNYSPAIGFLDVNVLNKYTHYYCTEINVM